MAAATSLAWRHRFPTRAVRRLSWYLFASSAITAVVWLLFGAEPARLPSGGTNLLALLPPITTALAGAGAVPFAAALIRRPRVGADHYALTVRPGFGRTLLLPWTAVAEVTAVTVAGTALLLVRRRPGGAQPGDRPSWYDQAVLRSAGTAATGYDLAVRMEEFAGDPADRLASLASWAPARVRVHFQD